MGDEQNREAFDGNPVAKVATAGLIWRARNVSFRFSSFLEHSRIGWNREKCFLS